MNCLEVRRILTATPDSPDPQIRIHLEQCPACARHAGEERAFEQELRGRLSQPAIPEGLTSRILLQHGLREERRQQRRQRYWQAIAASVLLSAGLVAGMLAINAPYSLEEVALAHVRDEPKALRAEGNVGLAKLNVMLAPYHLQLKQAIGRIAFAMPCHIRQYAGAHLVMEGEQGRVTVLIMPGEYVMARKTLKEKDLQAVLLPVEGGSIAIIGNGEASLAAIGQRLQQALVHTA